jgi:tRNA threonylcarbamoyladenosine biosynthesis protein TsaE
VQVPACFALRGELGAGKSVLARALARGAGVEGVLPSPTFNLVFRYGSDRGIDVVHLDLYRLERPDDVWQLGWRELGSRDELVVIEWPERAEQLLPRDRWDIVLETAAPDTRRLSARARGAAAAIPLPEV